MKLNRQDILDLLNTGLEEKELLFQHSAKIKEQHVGNEVFLRGLIELSNICSKDCYYCGIRKSNQNVIRYDLNDDEVLEAARFAYENRFGSIVIQGGEISGKNFIQRITKLIKEIKKLSKNELGITLSLGEQSHETYTEWFDAGAHRYLLRIETSNRKLYSKLHPDNHKHSYDQRMECLHLLKDVGYQTGTGVMIGLPGQTVEMLADDLLFMHAFDIDMVGMGPYIEHEDTPLYKEKGVLLPIEYRLGLSFKMIAILRIMMKDINIAATTAMQSIDKMGREKAIKIGANVLMPNITPGRFRDRYQLYQNKPCTDDSVEDCMNCVEVRVGMTGNKVGYSKWGDSRHFFSRINKQS